MQYLLELEDLQKHYDGFSLSGIDIKVAPGYVVGLIGSNGAGKTTTLKILTGIIDADGGVVSLLGHQIKAKSDVTDSIKARIGIVLDSCAFPGEYRVKDVAALGKVAYSTWNLRLWERLIEQFELAPDKKVKDMSRGMGMKLSLAFALAHEPDLLILDEATAGLDPMAREEVLEILRDFISDEKRGILIATHITSDLEKIADEIVCLDEGVMKFAVLKDTITDEAGIARLRADELELVLQSPLFADHLIHVLKHDHWTDVLVPDRFAFKKEFPQAVVDTASIEDYMTMVLKGQAR